MKRMMRKLGLICEPHTAGSKTDYYIEQGRQIAEGIDIGMNQMDKKKFDMPRLMTDEEIRQHNNEVRERVAAKDKEIAEMDEVMWHSTPLSEKSIAETFTEYHENNPNSWAGCHYEVDHDMYMQEQELSDMGFSQSEIAFIREKKNR